MMVGSKQIDFGELDKLVQAMKSTAQEALDQGTAIHEVEKCVLEKLMTMGHEILNAMFHAVEKGDVGETLQHPGHRRPLRRFPEPSTRAYRSIFGNFELTRYLYGKSTKSKSLAVPFDEHFGLPHNRFSLLLEHWVSQLCTSEAIHEAMDKLDDLLGIRIGVDSAERILARTGASAEVFQDNLPPVEVAEEGELLIESTDNKGIVMRHKPSVEKTPVGAPSGRVGPIPDRKQMATLSGCYSVDRYTRTPGEVLDALFHEPSLEDVEKVKRPRPKQARYQACLTQVQGHQEDTLNGEVSAIGWLSEHVRERRRPNQELINLNDGELSIWDNIENAQGQNNRIDIIDLLHVIQRVWDACAILEPENKIRFAKTHIRSILEGEVKRVVQSFRWQSTHSGLSGKSQKSMETICKYLEKNSERMKYNEYLERGYPISTGFIEGACRHVIKDRMERSGMRWTVGGAQNMLYLRCINAGKLWKKFATAHETRSLSHYNERANYIALFQLAACPKSSRLRRLHPTPFLNSRLHTAVGMVTTP